MEETKTHPGLWMIGDRVVWKNAHIGYDMAWSIDNDDALIGGTITEIGERKCQICIAVSGTMIWLKYDHIQLATIQDWIEACNNVMKELKQVQNIRQLI